MVGSSSVASGCPELVVVEILVTFGKRPYHANFGEAVLSNNNAGE